MRAFLSLCAVFALGGCMSDGYETVDGAKVDTGETQSEQGRSSRLIDIGLKRAIKQGATGSGVTIALIDTGVELDHPELADAISSKSASLTYGNSANDVAGHGTQMAGVMVAQLNGEGMVGIAADADLIAYKVEHKKGSGMLDASAISKGVYKAVDAGADVINLSIGGGLSKFEPLNEAISYAAFNDVIVVVATGNSGSDKAPVTSAVNVGTQDYGDTTIAVTAVNDDNEIASFAAPCDVYDPYYCIAAPGTSVTTTTLGGELTNVAGTSIATAITSASIATLLDYFPELSPSEAVEILLRTTTDLGEKGVDPIYGSGLINLDRAIRPVGQLSLNDNAPLKDLEKTSLQVSGAMGDAEAILASVAAVNFQDEYDRQYTVDLSQRIQSDDTSVWDRLSGTALRFHTQIPVDARNLLSLSIGRDDTAQSPRKFTPSGTSSNLYETVFDTKVSLRYETRFDDTALETVLQLGGGDLGETVFGAIHAHQRIGTHAQIGFGISKGIERGRFLGTTFSGSFGTVKTTETTSIHLSADWTRDRFHAFAQFAVGRASADYETGGLFEGIDAPMVSAWALGVDISDVAMAGDQVSFSLSQTPRLFAGTLIDSNSAAIDLTPVGRELVAEVGYEIPLGDRVSLGANLATVINPGHDQDAAYQTAFGVSLSMAF